MPVLPIVTRRIGWLLSRLSAGKRLDEAAAALNGRALPPAEDIPVLVRIRGRDFQKVEVLADGESHALRRARFHEDRIFVPLDRFLEIAQAKRIELRFDGETESYRLDEESAALLRDFATALDWHFALFRLPPVPRASE